MKLVFMGTPDYAVASLKALCERGYRPFAVITQPDKPKGRGNKMQSPPVKVLAEDLGIPVYQPQSMKKDGLELLLTLQPDLCVTAAFGQILPQAALDVPRLGTVNVHASLLPRYRGSAPINWCLINGETETGVTTMMTDKGVDTGDMLLKTVVPIKPEDDADSLTGRLAEAGAELLVTTIKRLVAGDIERQPQDPDQASYYPMLSREMSPIDWTAPAQTIVNKVRGLSPWPSATTGSPLGTVKIFQAQALAEPAGQPGEVLVSDPREGLVVAAGQGAVRLLTLQAPNAKKLSAGDFLRGRTLPVGSRLND